MKDHKLAWGLLCMVLTGVAAAKAAGSSGALPAMDSKVRWIEGTSGDAFDHGSASTVTASDISCTVSSASTLSTWTRSSTAVAAEKTRTGAERFHSRRGRSIVMLSSRNREPLLAAVPLRSRLQLW